MEKDKEYATFVLRYVTQQLKNFFPTFEAEKIQLPIVSEAINKVNGCIAKIKASKTKTLDHLNSGHYATFLYFLSRGLWELEKNPADATRIFLLNKALNGIDLYYEVHMPHCFVIGHTVGMVFAKAEYGEYLIFHQGCTVGRDGEGRPKIEDGVVLYPNSSIIGNCHVRENTVISPGVNLINRDTPGNCYVFPGEFGKPIFKEIDEYFVDRYFDR